MKTVVKAVVVCAVLAVVALAAPPPAVACCIPCQGFCTSSTPPNTPCCTGIPQPGNACGLTTCGKWLSRQRDDVDATSPAVAVKATADCVWEAIFAVEPADVEPSDAPAAG